MPIDLDTFLVTVYTQIDDLYQHHIQPRCPHRRGRPPRVSDSEILTMLLCAQWLGCSERRLLRHAASYWQAYFPQLLSQSAYNRRVRRLGGVCTELVLLLARDLGATDPPFQLADTVGVPLARLCRGKHRRCFGNEAASGLGGSDRHFYYGCQLLLATTPAGVITGLLVAPANTESRWLLDALLGWRADPAGPLWAPRTMRIPQQRQRTGYVGPTGPRWSPASVGTSTSAPYLVDNGFTGTTWQPHWQQDYGATVITFKDYPPAGRAARRVHHRQRHRIETVYALLGRVFHLAYPGGRTMWGVVTRVVAKCAAFNCAIWLNRHFGRPLLAVGTVFPG